MDFTERYNTPLEPFEETQYQDWARASGLDPVKERYDYDLQGLWKQQQTQNPMGAEPMGDGHFPDTFKKPNHPTFSTFSQYHGEDGLEGGEWTQHPDQTWTFAPGRTNIENHGLDGLKDYFGRVEPGNHLALPVDHDPFEAAAARVRAPYAKANARVSGLPDVLDYFGNKIVSAATAPMDAYTGKLQVSDPSTGMPTPEAMKRANEVAGMAGMSAMPFAEKGAAGVFGGKLGSATAGDASIAPMSKLKQAEYYADKGYDNKILQKTTGWYKDDDGHFKFYIPDDNVSLKLPPLESNAFGQDWLQAPKFGEDPRKLDEVLDHPELYRHYPDLKDIKVTGVSGIEAMNGIKGWFNDKTNTLAVSSGPKQEIMDTIIHEVQHAIQKKEGFPPGANSAWFQSKELPDAQKMLEGNRLSLNDKLVERGIVPRGEEWWVHAAAKKGYHEMEEVPHGVGPKQRAVVAMMKAHPDLYPEINMVRDLQQHVDKLKNEAFQSYHNVAGEVEARNAAKWALMSPQERQQTYPWLTAVYDPKIGVKPMDRIYLRRDANGNVVAPRLVPVEHDPFK